MVDNLRYDLVQVIRKAGKLPGFSLDFKDIKKILNGNYKKVIEEKIQNVNPDLIAVPPVQAIAGNPEPEPENVSIDDYENPELRA